MPPKVKYSRELICDVAYRMVEEHGKESISARSIASALGCSTAPIFTAFSSVEDIKNAVKERAYALYCTYIAKALESELPFKASGLAYIRYAKEHPKLFKLLFMVDGEAPIQGYFPGGDIKNEKTIRSAIKETYGKSDDAAKKLYNHLSIYTHGIAVLFAEGYATFSDEDISTMLSEAFFAFKGERE